MQSLTGEPFLGSEGRLPVKPRGQRGHVSRFRGSGVGVGVGGRIVTT